MDGSQLIYLPKALPSPKRDMRKRFIGGNKTDKILPISVVVSVSSDANLEYIDIVSVERESEGGRGLRKRDGVLFEERARNENNLRSR